MARPGVSLLADWTLEELRALEEAAASHGLAGPGEVSTLQMAQALIQQILGYQRELWRGWTATGRALAEAARWVQDGRLGGRAQALGVGREVLERGVERLSGAAEAHFARAFRIGLALAGRLGRRPGLAEAEAAALVQAEVRRNAALVRERLMGDLWAAFERALGEAEPPEAVRRAADRFEGRVGMYATKLWGLGHLGFAVGVLGPGGVAPAAFSVRRGAQVEPGPLLAWVVTSGRPCPDCERLAREGPYQVSVRPLPTVPGLGETRCRTNCLCLLVAVPTIAGAAEEEDEEEAPA